MPLPMMERYSSRSAAQKLGIKENSLVGLINAPRDYVQVLGELPGGVMFSEDDLTQAAVTLCFITDADSLRSAMAASRRLAAATKLWFLWRKKAAKSLESGVTERLIRETGIALGLVDYKICSVNQTWSAMLFALKR